jgi:hypothetical protein
LLTAVQRRTSEARTSTGVTSRSSRHADPPVIMPVDVSDGVARCRLVIVLFGPSSPPSWM